MDYLNDNPFPHLLVETVLGHLLMCVKLIVILSFGMFWAFGSATWMYWPAGGGRVYSTTGLQNNPRDAEDLKSSLLTLQGLYFVLAVVWGWGLETH